MPEGRVRSSKATPSVNFQFLKPHQGRRGRVRLIRQVEPVQSPALRQRQCRFKLGPIQCRPPPMSDGREIDFISYDQCTRRTTRSRSGRSGAAAASSSDDPSGPTNAFNAPTRWSWPTLHLGPATSWCYCAGSTSRRTSLFREMFSDRYFDRWQGRRPAALRQLFESTVLRGRLIVPRFSSDRTA